MNKLNIYKIIVIIFGIILMFSYLIPILFLKSEFSNISLVYLLSFFIFVSFIISYLSNTKLSNNDKYQTLSYTMSFAIFGVIFIPIFVFNNLKIKDAIITIILFFCWITSTKIFSNFLTKQNNKYYYLDS